jgi:L-threonylcarbamoyladenylate synthase
MEILAASPSAIARAVQVLRRGGVAAYPTDTLYGLAVDPRNARAVERLFELKGRERSSAMPLIASSLEQAQAAGEFSDSDLRLARAFWPGPLTIVVPAKATIASELLGIGSTIAVRVPSQPVATALASGLGFCITSTSANRSGRSPAATAEDASRDLGDGIDVVLDGGPSPGGPPSTIVELSAAGPRLIRAGAVPWERVLEFLDAAAP